MRRLPYRYNQRVVKSAAVIVFVATLLFCTSLRAQDGTPQNPAAPGQTAGRTVVVIPFENASPTPGLEWLGESFSETFHEQLNSPVLFIASRDERLRAYDRQGVPSGVHPSRATLYRIAEQMDVDYAVLGSYKYDGTRLTATAQLLDMRAQKLLPQAAESAPLADLGHLQSALAWDLLRQIRADFSVPKDRYIASVAPIRLDALENYVRGMLAATAEEKVQHYRDATRLNPDFAQAWLELGKTYYAQRSYEPAIAARVKKNAFDAPHFVAKKGDALIISSSKAADGSSLTAFSLVAGVEPFLAAAPRTAGQVDLGAWSIGAGMPEQ